jgi:DNA polymerase-1
MERTKKEAMSAHMVKTLFGRRRKLLNTTSVNQQERGEAERMAINTPIQGTAADLIKIAMLRVHKRLSEDVPKARLLLQVHDELIVETPEKQADKVEAILREEMLAAGTEEFFEGAKTLKVPLKVDTVISRRWS